MAARHVGGWAIAYLNHFEMLKWLISFPIRTGVAQARTRRLLLVPVLGSGAGIRPLEDGMSEQDSTRRLEELRGEWR